MTIKLPKLPYSLDALEPYFSKETIEYHYGKHHQNYVTKLQGLIANSAFENKSLEEIILTSSGSIFNNAAQAYNHNFYWQCLTANSTKLPGKVLLTKINENFINFSNFQQLFTAASMEVFGSGWTWLVQKQDKSLAIVNTTNANTPITVGEIPLLTCDVWEHAYYIDYRNMRAKYVEAFWQIINWQFVESNLVI